MAKNKKNNKTESLSQTFHLFFSYLLDLIVCLYMLLILVVLPFYNEEGFTHIGTDKSMFFRACAVRCGWILVPVLCMVLIMKLVLFFKKPDKDIKAALVDFFKNKVSVTDYFAFAYGVAVVISYAFTAYKEEAWWGTTGWFMGMLPHLFLVISFFLVSRAWTRRRWMLLLVLIVSAIVFGLGYLNRFGIFPIDMKVDHASFVSTIGNINWYCGYLMSVFFAGFFLLWKKDWKENWQKWLLMAYVALGFSTLVTHGSSSGIVAMAGIILVTFCLSVSDGKRMEAFWLEMCLLSTACILTAILRHFEILTITFEEMSSTLFTTGVVPILMTVVSFAGYFWIRFSNHKAKYPKKFLSILSKVACVGVAGILLVYIVILAVNTLQDGGLLAGTALADSQMFIFTPKWGSNRGATWMAGLRAFGEQDILHKLVGVGPDCMAAFLYDAASPELLGMVQDRFGNARLTNAHNEWITILVNIGLLGFVSFVGLMVSAIKRFIGSRDYNLVAGACGFCLLAYTINNMFSFQTSMSVSTIFVVLGIGENYLRNQKKKAEMKQ